MLFEKLFMGFAFDFWDPARPVSLYFILYAAACAAIAVIIHWAVSKPQTTNALFKQKNIKAESGD